MYIYFILISYLHLVLSADIYLREDPVKSYNYLGKLNITTYQVTDGQVHVRASGDNLNKVLVSCQVTSDVALIAKLSKDIYRTSVSDGEWTSLLQRCEQQNRIYSKMYNVRRQRSQRQRREVKWTERSTVRPTFIPQGNKLGNILILNGTTWCGTGNTASSFDDLGHYSGVDQCCRAHDYCPDFIPMFSTKYRYSNILPYTLSHCACDYKFYRCLKDAKTKKADDVGDLFFNTIGVACFNFEYGEYCADTSSFLFCTNRKFGPTVALNNVLSNIWAETKDRVALDP